MADVKYVSYFPVLSLLGAVLVVLKLLGHITISWWWVTLPFWAPIAVAVALVTILGFGFLLVAAIKS